MQGGVWRCAAAVRRSLFSSCCYSPAQFHSTPFYFAKWRSKWKHTGEECQRPSKTYIRYTVRQKRSDAKKALKNYLIYGRSELHMQAEDLNWYPDTNDQHSEAGNSKFAFNDDPHSRNPGKSKPRDAGKGKNGNKRWRCKRRFSNEDDYENPETVMRASSGKHTCYTWSVPFWENFFENSTQGFEWRNKEETKTKRRVYSESDIDEEDDLDECESRSISSSAHRVTLGLPLTGPLKLDDIKSAFRVSALKWHPDKHQGSSEVMAAEKFKLCVDAYNSLCSTIKAN